MCQLTFVHGDPLLSKVVMSNLTLINAADGNKDGHGFFVVNNQKFYKTTATGQDAVFDENYTDQLEKMTESIRGNLAVMSHVRSASVFPKVVSLDNTHPFILDDLVLMHNGTLEPKDDKYKIDEKIDSYWYLNRLVEISKGKNLTPSWIAKAMEDFTGKFAFLIYDKKQKDKIFIVRGSTAPLNFSYIYEDCESDNKRSTFVINTSSSNLETLVLPMFYKFLYGKNIKTDACEEFDKESIYTYNINTQKLQKSSVEIKEEVKKRQYTVIRSNYGKNKSSISSFVSSERKVKDVSKLLLKLGMGFSESNYLFHLMFGYSILFITSDDLEKFETFLKNKLLDSVYKKQGGERKRKFWINITSKYVEKNNNIVLLDIYKETNLNFPWFINSKGALKNVLSSRI